MLEIPISAPGLTVGQAIVGDDALDALEHDAHARRLAADAMRCAHDHGWVIVAREPLQFTQPPVLGGPSLIPR